MTGWGLAEIAGDAPCDRCGHPAKQHWDQIGWSCSYRPGKRPAKAREHPWSEPAFCPCDAFWPVRS